MRQPTSKPCEPLSIPWVLLPRMGSAAEMQSQMPYRVSMKSGQIHTASERVIVHFGSPDPQ